MSERVPWAALVSLPAGGGMYDMRHGASWDDAVALTRGRVPTGLNADHKLPSRAAAGGTTERSVI